jgi:hypothetical protein
MIAFYTIVYFIRSYRTVPLSPTMAYMYIFISNTMMQISKYHVNYILFRKVELQSLASRASLSTFL